MQQQQVYRYNGSIRTDVRGFLWWKTYHHTVARPQDNLELFAALLNEEKREIQVVDFTNYWPYLEKFKGMLALVPTTYKVQLPARSIQKLDGRADPIRGLDPQTTRRDFVRCVRDHGLKVSTTFDEHKPFQHVHLDTASVLFCRPSPEVIYEAYFDCQKVTTV